MMTHMRVGDAYVHLARGHGSAVFAQGCDGIRVENVTVHASPGLVVGLVGNRGEIRVRGLEVRFAPNTTRLLTANADGVHCQQNRSGPIIEECYFEGMADDGINLYAPPNVLREIRTPTQWLVSPGTLILPGDRLQVLDPKTGRLRGDVKVAGGRVEQRAFLINLDRPVVGVVAGADHRTGDTLYNLATNVTARDNRITASATAAQGRSASSILIENSSGVALPNNTVSDPRPGTTAALEIAPSVASGDSGVRVSGLRSSLGPGIRPILDRRASPTGPR